MFVNKLTSMSRFVQISYLSWVTNPRILLIPMAIILFYESTWSPMLSLSRDNGYLINALEPYILLSNDGSMAPLIIIVYIMLLADYPMTASSGYFVVVRSSRKAWLYSNLVFSEIAALTWQMVLVGSSILLCYRDAFFADAWSLYTSRFFSSLPEVYSVNQSSFIDSSVYAHFKPVSSFLLSLLLQNLSMVFASCVVMLFKLLGRHFIGIVCSIAVYALGMMTWALVSPLMWFLPTANSVVGWHYNKFYAGAVFPVWGSILYFIVLITAILLLCRYLVSNFMFSEHSE